MVPLKGLFVTVLLWLSGISSLSAGITYQAAAEDINARLDKTLALYQDGRIEEAKAKIQMAYFDVYEGIEGAIRMNYSREYSYALEARFAQIRTMIADGQPMARVREEIQWLQSQVAELPAVLASGYQTQESVAQDVLPFWRDQVEAMDSLLNQALASYRQSPVGGQKNQQKAHALVQQAQYRFYKNANLEAAIRRYRSLAKAADYNDRFKRISQIAQADYSQEQLVRFSYELSTLIQDLQDDLPGLPALGEEQKPQPRQDVVRDWQPVIGNIVQAIEGALEEYRRGQAEQAMVAVQNAYFDFFEASGMEASVGARDAGLKAELESHFTGIVSLMKAGADSEQIQARLVQLREGLGRGAALLSRQGTDGWALFIASLTIILREGLEALLIVAAITTWLIRNNAQDRLHVIKNAVVTGLLASLASAVLFQWLFSRSGLSRELLEAATMLLASVVLFFMSYWLLSKVEAHQWQRYLENRLSRAISAGSLFGLWSASFLAVYREGAETLLFYYALAAEASSASLIGLFAGFAVGVVLLLVVFLMMRYSLNRLPLKPFFMVTGGFMYLMAFIFAGKGVLELIESKVFQPTLLAAVPGVDWLGIYPYLETLLPQGILLGAALVALVIIRQRGRQPVAVGH